MRVLLINSTCGTGSTGRICAELAQNFESEGHDVKIAYGRDGYVPEEYKKYGVRIGTNIDVCLHGVYTRITDRHGFATKSATKKFLKWVNAYNPDLVWLHNIHGYYINVPMLFEWIKSRPAIQIKWTLHDCWAFTGHCTNFTYVKCEQWKSQCTRCLQKNTYPKSIWKDNCHQNFSLKKIMFTGIKNMTLITPSKWLSNLVNQSFLREYKVEVVRNKINTNVFKPTPSDFREKYNLGKRPLVLGVANVWNARKGLCDFFKLREMLDEQYSMCLVGLNAKQLKSCPRGIIGIGRTNSPEELAKIYTAADIFFNPTYEDNYPTVNLEAEACGTPVITYDTGGCRETLARTDSVLIATGDINNAKKIICGEGKNGSL